MSKVFAVMKNQTGTPEVISWPSSKAFIESGHEWTDKRYVCIATTKEHKKNGLYTRFELLERSFEGHAGLIPKTSEELLAHDLMTMAFMKHFKRSVPKEAISAIRAALKKYDSI